MSTPLTSQALDPSTDEKVDLLLSAKPPGYQATPYEVPPRANPEPERRSRCHSCCRRFGHFFVALFVLWLAAQYLFRHYGVGRFGPHCQDPATEDYEHDKHLKGPHHDIDVCVDPGDWSEYDPDDSEGHQQHLEMWRKTELSLPNTADDIFLISKGFQAMGVLHLTEATDREDIGVEVIAGFHENSDMFEKTKLCTLRRHGGDNGHGVGIFIPKLKHHKQDALFFNVTVSLPKGEDVTTIPNFATHLPLFGHIVKRLPTHKFDSVALNSANGPMHIEDLVGNKIRIHSGGGPVEGTFNTTSSLDIKTRNSPVKVIVNAFNHDNAVPTKVNIKASNGPLSAQLSLISTQEDQTSGVFHVHTRTSNSPLAVNFTEHPPDALLKLKAHTSNSPALVHLHPSFEGVFKLRTSTLPALVHVEDDLEDPADRGRKRVVHANTVGRFASVVDGDVAWVPQDEGLAPAGKVKVSTTHSPLRLVL